MVSYIRTRLFRFVSPEISSICDAGTLSSLARNFISALFAFPSTGGACSLIFIASSNIPTTLFVDARGIRRTLIIVPLSVSVIMLMIYFVMRSPVVSLGTPKRIVWRAGI